MRPGLLPKGGREVNEKEESETEAEGCCFLDFVVFPVDVTVCAHSDARTHITKIKVIISRSTAVVYHYHILIDHEDDISCLQLEGKKTARLSCCPCLPASSILPNILLGDLLRCLFLQGGGVCVCERKCTKVPEVGSESEKAASPQTGLLFPQSACL